MGLLLRPKISFGLQNKKGRAEKNVWGEKRREEKRKREKKKEDEEKKKRREG